MKETHYDLDTNKQRPATQAEPDRLTANSASITPGHGCKDISVSVTAESTVELVTHNPSGVNVWYALLIDGLVLPHEVRQLGQRGIVGRGPLILYPGIEHHANEW